MANELTLSASASYSKSGVTAEMSKGGLLVTVTGTRYQKVIQQIGIVEEVLQITELASLGYCLIKNLDSTNFVELRVATAGVKFLKLKAGEIALFRFGSGITAPFAIADTAPCYVEMLIFEN